MPVAQFPGDRNWGYDGVHPYAVQNSYGGPRGFSGWSTPPIGRPGGHSRRGLQPLRPGRKLSGQVRTLLHRPLPHALGQRVNFDGPHSDAVRQFFIDNACAWVRDFHVDGLRLDAVQRSSTSAPGTSSKTFRRPSRRRPPGRTARST